MEQEDRPGPEPELRCGRQISWAIRRYGDRAVALAGVVSATSSLALCGFATGNLGGLIFLQGVCYGISSGMLYLVRGGANKPTQRGPEA